MVTEEVAVESEAAMCVVRLRRTELKCLIDLYYRGRTDNELLKTCARALQVGQDRKAPGSVAFKLSSAQRDTLLAATYGRRAPGLGDLVPLLKEHFDQMPAPVRRRRRSPAPGAKKGKASKNKGKSKSVWTVSGGLPTLGHRR